MVNLPRLEVVNLIGACIIAMKGMIDFLNAVREDPRIATAHISLYLVLYKLWVERNFEQPLSIFSHEVMPACKISSSSTFHKTIRELHSFGYIDYEPSFNRFEGSLVLFKVIKEVSDEFG